MWIGMWLEIMTIVIHLITVGNKKKTETDNEPTWTLVNKYPGLTGPLAIGPYY